MDCPRPTTGLEQDFFRAVVFRTCTSTKPPPTLLATISVFLRIDAHMQTCDPAYKRRRLRSEEELVVDDSRFDALARFLATRLSRRGAAPLTASLLAVPLLSTTVEAKKNKKKTKLKKKKKKCNQNPDNRWCKNKCRTVTTDPQNCGACNNACSSGESCIGGSCCTPTTCAAEGIECGTISDECGGTLNCGACAADAICDEGVCHTCTVTCEGNNAACGVALQTALDAGGNVVACPGRYVGNFLVDTANVTLIGAGEGDDPASNTILDADQVGRALHIESGFIVTVSNLRITGGNDDGPGGGVRNEGTLTMTSCTIIDNTTTSGSGGISQNQFATGPLTLTDCTVADNDCDLGGGGISQANPTHAVTLNNCIVSGNEADAAGGGINVQNGTVNINGGSITDNTAGGEGGGIFNSEFGTVNLDDAEVSGNTPDNCTNVPGC
jgi:hypothetical protein